MYELFLLAKVAKYFPAGMNTQLTKAELLDKYAQKRVGEFGLDTSVSGYVQLLSGRYHSKEISGSIKRGNFIKN
jgi:hypothetical protein